jgi:hypothetical protein
MADISEEVMKLAADLAAAPARLAGAVHQVVAKGALNVKNNWRGAVSGAPHLPQFPYSITYDMTYAPGVVGAEIGPDKGKPQGPLGNIVEFGTANNAPGLQGQRALAAEDPRFTAALEDAVVKATLS